ncbi:hypothetical protein [Desulfatirhabdium butyrativorans]|uniref:hypothetical protein n=1 Tax=Desulfatirhabdium butyrativorans TaxID=340467 RepID=UPI0004280F36|nr:hypothetical protein [Desulfatirhabdium butyrativorans]
MKKWKYLLTAIVSTFLFTAVSVSAQVPVSLDLQSDGKNPSSPVMGDHLQFWSTITNTGTSPIEGLVAWVSLVEIDPGNEQPVDLEDWSAHKAVTGVSLAPGKSLRTDWPMRLIKAGDYRVVISVTDRIGRQVHTSPTIQFHVRQKPVLQAGRVIPVAAGIPLLIVGLMVFNKAKQRHKRVFSTHGQIREG